MKTDSEIREDIIRELQWDPQILDPEAIGVAVKDGAVTLTGHTPTYAQKLAAVRAAERVYGVKAVADEIKVELSGEPRDDTEIALAIAHVLGNNTQIPEGKVHARVRGGWVTLEGEAEWDYQRREVERMVRHVPGVVGISNAIVVKQPTVSPEQVQAKIEEAFKREAEVDARHVRVEVSDHTARLYGHVHSLTEVNAAASAAAAAPGVARVENHLVAADLMHRNLNRRVEALVTVTDPAQQADLRNLIALAMGETTASWWLAAGGTWARHHRDSSGQPLRDLQQHLLASTRGRAVDG